MSENAVPSSPRQPPPNEPRSYHGQPVIKEPIWTWEIPCYFFVGGLAGASANLAFLSGLRGDEVLARRAWTNALIGIGLSPPLLISDLGRPERFFNMLRLFKVTSPMSVGSWILSVSGVSTAVAATNALTGRLPRLARTARPAAALFGLPLSTYTAALLANTAVPAWHEGHRLLPFVFGSGAALSAGAAGVVSTPPAHAAAARRVALAGALCELGANELMRHGLGEHGEPYKSRSAARFGQISRACVATGAALLYWRGARSRVAATGAGKLLLAGALCARWSVYKAGFSSASDPKYTVAPQRSRIDNGEVRGGAKAEAKVLSADRVPGSPASLR